MINSLKCTLYSCDVHYDFPTKTIFGSSLSQLTEMYLILLWCPLRFPHKNDFRFVFTSTHRNVPYTLVMSITISPQKRFSVRLYLQWLEEGSFLNYFICVCLRIVVSNTYCVVFFCFVCLRLECPMLTVSLDCPFLIAPSVSLTFI